MGGKSGGNSRQLQRQQDQQEQQDRERENRIREGMGFLDEQFGQFDDDFYQKQRQAHLDYANPQAERQFNDANEGLVYALNRANLGQSTAGNRAMSRLGSEYEQAQDDIARKAMQTESEARQNVTRERQNLSNLIQSTADPNLARDQMPGIAQALSQTPAFDSVGQMFGDVTRGIGAYQEGQAFRQAQQNTDAAYSSNPSSSSGRTVR